jgi:hypothetical protein
LKVPFVVVPLAAAVLAACGGEDQAQRPPAAAPKIQKPVAAAPEQATTSAEVRALRPARHKPAQARVEATPSGGLSQAVEVPVHRGAKLFEIRKGVRQLLGRGRAPKEPAPKNKSKPLVPMSTSAPKKTAPARKHGPSLLDRLAQGKLPTR